MKGPQDGRAEAVLRVLGGGGGAGTIASLTEQLGEESESGALPEHWLCHQ